MTGILTDQINQLKEDKEWFIKINTNKTNNMKQTLNQELITKLARLDTLETYKRAMLSDYMSIKSELESLRDEVEDLENKLLNIDSAENDKRFDELMGCPMEAIEELTTKPWSHADDENDQER